MFMVVDRIAKVGRYAKFILAGIIMAAAITTALEAAPEEQPSVFGKYPNSMLIRTRAASTYPANQWTFTLVSYYQDFNQKRGISDDMESVDEGVERWQLTGILWAEYGITNRFQAGISAPFISRRYKDEGASIDQSEQGPGDFSLYAKYRLVNETQSVPAIAIDTFIKMPTGDKAKGLGNDQWDYTLGLELSKRFNKWSFHINPEYVITGGTKAELGEAADDKTSLNIGIMYHATATLVPMVELNSWWWGAYGEQTEIGGGLLWFPAKNTSIKMGISVPVEIDMPWGYDWMPWVKIAIWF